jgi:FkbM family methyltransferase
MPIPAWIKEPILHRLYQRIGITYNSVGVPLAMTKYLKKGTPMKLIDVGARTGEFARVIERYCGIERALLVEPQPDHAAFLRAHFPAPRFDVAQCALSDKPGTMELEINQFDATTSILPTKREIPENARFDVSVARRVPCELQTLDALTRQLEFGPVDLLKVDVQGAEHLVFAGAPETLRSVKMIWCEVSFRPLYVGSSLFGDIYDQMVAAGFGLFELEGGFRTLENEMLQADAFFVRR